MSPVGPARPSAEELERLFFDLSSRFIRLAPDEVDREIEAALRRICELLEIDFAVLWQWSVEAPEVIAPTHSYFAQDGPRPSEPMSQEQYPWAREEMLAGRIILVRALQDLPAAASVDRETCRLYGVQSVLCLPLALGGEPPVGALGFNCLQKRRDWPEELVNWLQLVAQLFIYALVRQRHELNIQESAARLQAGADLAGLAFYEVDLEARVARVDNRFRQICGLPVERELGFEPLEFWLENLHPDDREAVLELRRRLHGGELATLATEYRFQNPVRGERWLHHVAHVSRLDAAGRAVRTFGVLRDVTERKVAEDERRDLSRRLIRAQEEERAMLARELHDDLTQRLAVLAIEVGRAENAATDPAQTQAMQAIREGLVRLSDDVHALASQLHPSVLEELGLAEALRAEGERLSRQGGIDLAVKIAPLPAVVGKAVALCLFRVAQEALSNVIRHAGARAASVDLQPMDGGLLLAVRDDGVGFNGEDPGKRRSLGLLSMEERVRLQNGTLDIESAPGRGTSIVAWLPAEDGET